MNIFWRPSPRQRRDRHIEAAQEFLHLAVRNLELASAAAYEMGDAGFRTDLRSHIERLFAELRQTPPRETA